MSPTLREQFLKVIESSDEQAAKDFLIDHLKEFPENVQQTIIVAFFEQALQESAEAIMDITTLQQEVLVAFEATEKAQKGVADKQKELEVSSRLDS